MMIMTLVKMISRHEVIDLPYARNPQTINTESSNFFIQLKSIVRFEGSVFIGPEKNSVCFL